MMCHYTSIKCSLLSSRPSGPAATITWGTPAAGTHAGTHAGTAISVSATHTSACLLRAKKIEAVVDMKHHIAVDGIILRIRTGCSRNGTREGALLAENIVELQHDGKRLALQETLRELRIPYKLIRIHAAVAITAAAADREA